MNDNDNDNNNPLGFSLSPHMNMDASTDPHHHHYHHRQQHHHHYHQTQAAAAVSPAVPTSFFLAPPQIETQGGALYSQLSVMPLKSDGSLCIMEALTRSQQGEGVMPELKSPELSKSSLYRYSREVIVEYIPKFVYTAPKEGLVGMKDVFDVSLEGVLRRFQEQRRT